MPEGGIVGSCTSFMFANMYLKGRVTERWLEERRRDRPPADSLPQRAATELSQSAASSPRALSGSAS